MSSSEARLNELPTLVFTNTRDDYRVTVRTQRIGAKLDRVVERMARSCSSSIVDGFVNLVGVIAVPDRPAELLAFRVFDVGIFRGRPHTLGLVGIVVPPKRNRSWRIDQALSKLEPPVPDSAEYQMPPVRLSEVPACADEPFVSLRKWEDTEGETTTNLPVVFCSPRSLTPKTDSVPPPPPPGGRSWALLVLVVAAIAILAGVGVALLQGPGERPPRKRKTGQDQTKEKRRIQDALYDVVRSDNPLVQTPSPIRLAVLKERLVEVSKKVKRRMRILAGQLQSDDPESQKDAIHQKETLWDREKVAVSGSLVETKGPSPDSGAVDGAIETLARYKRAVGLMEELTETDHATDDFAAKVLDLRQILKGK